MGQAISVVEVFSSIQGEGQYVGYRQLFVRMAGCNAACLFCDTPASRDFVTTANIECTAGQRDFSQVKNPLLVTDLAKAINHLLVVPHHSVSLTGGEPLLQTSALLELMPLIKGRIFLETNGTLPAELTKVLSYVDIISMDIKLPSSVGRDYWTEHQEFLQVASSREVFVKIVVTGLTTENEFMQAIQLIANVRRTIPVIVQPVTPVEGCSGITPEQVLKFQEQALSLLTDVRVIPQTHKYMGQM